jgi:hypothetical protein
VISESPESTRALIEMTAQKFAALVVSVLKAYSERFELGDL